MSRVKMLILGALAALVLAVGAFLPLAGDLGGGGSAQAEPLPKMQIVHFTGSDTNPWVILCVSGNAVPAHVANHGDIVLGCCEGD